MGSYDTPEHHSNIYVNPLSFYKSLGVCHENWQTLFML